MKLPNLYLRFSSSEMRTFYVYRLLRIDPSIHESAKHAQELVDRMEVGVTSSPYYRAYRYAKLETPLMAGEWWLPSKVHLLGIRRIYFKRVVNQQYGYWLVLQVLPSSGGKQLFSHIISSIHKEYLVVVNGRIPYRLLAEMQLSRAKRLLDKEPLTNMRILESIQELLDEAFTLDPGAFTGDRVYFWEQLGLYWSEFHQLGRMEHCFRQQAKLQRGSGDAFLNMGFHYSAVGEFKRAEQAYLEGLRTNPNDEYIYHNLTQLYLNIGSRKNAFKAINEAILHNPELASIFKLKGDLHTYWDELDAALQ
ncbi:hypothetical protein SAMN04487897_103337 [Paenibacillus sp. yr247]|uniref:tetratricopeptide repeat protein n=1 Tax=Paenibacillus sp. yr247 TaxID=1761880 RepID=UPI00087F380A|nr:hypothetical protein [Paenibacillus sp. yr247]SDN61203.1 hypothetical protein SAMN04487897_103337 [Paenibacillus sp. yr247]